MSGVEREGKGSVAVRVGDGGLCGNEGSETRLMQNASARSATALEISLLS